MPDAPKTSVVYESSSFAQYKSVNEKFAEAIVANYREGDVGEYLIPPVLLIKVLTISRCTPSVWVNDYHLCLVPQLVRQKLPDAPIGFFLHVAWPSTEIFRCLAGKTCFLCPIKSHGTDDFQTLQSANNSSTAYSVQILLVSKPTTTHVISGRPAVESCPSKHFPRVFSWSILSLMWGFSLLESMLLT